MMSTTDDVFAFLDDLSVATWTSVAIAALFESGAIDGLTEPRTTDELATRCRGLTRAQLARCLDVAVANGLVVRDGDRLRVAETALPLLEQPLRQVVAADVRSALMQGISFLDASTGEHPRVGWLHEDPRVLRAQGEGSAMIARMLKRRLAPSLAGLTERLDGHDARFLDVGVGVAALSIEMCRVFPAVKVVGLDVHDPALACARESVARASLESRIELRKLRVEDMRDEGAFDLAWLPSFFIPNAACAVERIHAALRPGGWLVCAVVGVGESEQRNAAWSLVGELWGGATLSPVQVEEAMRASGFSTIERPPSPPGIAFVAARK